MTRRSALENHEGFVFGDRLIVRLSLVIPAVDSRDVILACVDSALRHLERFPGAEVILVDDRSSGDVAALVEPATREGSALRVLKSDEPGTAAAVRAGLLAAEGELVVVTEADLAYPLAEIDRLVAALDDGADVAAATRFDRESRILLSPPRFHSLYAGYLAHRAFNAVVRAVLHLAVTDSLAGFKGFRHAAARSVAARQTVNGLSFHVELLYLSQRFGLTIREVPVLYRPATDPPPARRFGELARALADVWRIRQNASRGRYR